MVLAAHLAHLIPRITPRDKNRWALSLLDAAAPVAARPMSSVDALTASEQFLDYLDVAAAAHLRYVKTTIKQADGTKKSQTFCNVYAHDCAALAGAYMPLVWWTAKALVAIDAGQQVVAERGKTVTQPNANRLFEWFGRHADQFGWNRVDTAARAQDAADDGRVAVIIAKAKPGRAGHIAVVVAQTNDVLAEGAGANVVPVLSQAGSTNFRRSIEKGRWWTGSRFAASAIWVHSGLRAPLP